MPSCTPSFLIALQPFIWNARCVSFVSSSCSAISAGCRASSRSILLANTSSGRPCSQVCMCALATSAQVALSAGFLQHQHLAAAVRKCRIIKAGAAQAPCNRMFNVKRASISCCVLHESHVQCCTQWPRLWHSILLCCLLDWCRRHGPDVCFRLVKLLQAASTPSAALLHQQCCICEPPCNAIPVSPHGR